MFRLFIPSLCAFSWLLFERVAATAADAFLGSVGQNFVADPCAFIARGTQQLNVRDRQRTFFFNDAALHVLGRVRPRVPLDHARVFHHDRPRPWIHRENAAGFSAIASGHYTHLIASLDARRGWIDFHPFSYRHYQTSGASETIFANFFSRNSRATGPNTRVPTGSFASLISTAALSSNRM